MNFRYVIGVLALFIWVACANPNQEQVEKLDKQIMDTHDEVMPKMGEVLKLRKQIQAKLDSCANPACTDTLNKLSYALTKADADMMKWMRAYRKPGNHDSALVYLEGQWKAINVVKTQILGSIVHAEAYLKLGK